MSDALRSQRMLLLTRFGTISAGTRYRITQFVPYLRRAGIECDLRPLFPDVYVAGIFGARPRRLTRIALAPIIAAGYVRRWIQLSRAQQYDLVHLQYEALPFLPFRAEERLYGAGPRVIVDLDDAVFLTYQSHPSPVVRRLLGSKVPNVVSRSDRVITANRYLTEWASTHNAAVTLIPNAIDLRRYSPRPERRRAGARPIVIGWMGTPITAKYLQELREPLRQLARRYEFVLRVVGAQGVSLPGVTVETVPWSEATEVRELNSFDIGVAPLSADQWSQGKSALKLIQLLAAGVPSVASPVGANADVVSDGDNGFLAATVQEWVDKISLLIENPGDRQRLGEAGRRTVEERFSLEKTAKQFVSLVQQTG